MRRATPSLQAVTPLSINPAGTSLQVQVPTLATTGAIQVVNVANRNLGFNSYNDAIYRGMTVQFTATSSTSAINFADGGLEGINNESWGIDNVSVSQGATTIFSDNFESGTANAAWTQNVVDSSTPGAFTSFLGRFSSGGDTLNLSGLTAGQTYTLKFDLYAIDSLDGLGGTLDGSGNIIPAQSGPDVMNVTIDGSRKLSLAMSYATTEVQNFNGSATLPLQIVPTLSSMDGSPSGDGTFNLFGSGFQAGAMTVTVGGVTLPNSQFTNQYQNHILGGNNGQDRIVAPLVLDGPVTVTTAGGSATLPGYSFPAQPPVQFTGITATASSGVPANGAVGVGQHRADDHADRSGLHQLNPGAVPGPGRVRGQRPGGAHRHRRQRRHHADHRGAGAGAHRHGAGDGQRGFVSVADRAGTALRRWRGAERQHDRARSLRPAAGRGHGADRRPRRRHVQHEGYLRRQSVRRRRSDLDLSMSERRKTGTFHALPDDNTIELTYRHFTHTERSAFSI